MKASGPDTDELSLKHLHIGTLYQNRGRFREAEKSYFEAKRICEVLHGDDHVSVASMYGQLANLFSDMELYAECDKARSEAIRILRMVNGEKSEDLGIALTNVALSHLMQEKNCESIELFMEALSIFDDAAVERESPFVARACCGLTKALTRTGKVDEALEMAQDAYDIALRLWGRESGDFAFSLGAMAEVHEAQGRFEVRIPFFEACRVCFEAIPLVWRCVLKCFHLF